MITFYLLKRDIFMEFQKTNMFISQVDHCNAFSTKIYVSLFNRLLI